MTTLPTPPEALHSAARIEVIRPKVSAPPLFSVMAVSWSVMSAAASSGSWDEKPSTCSATVSGEATRP